MAPMNPKIKKHLQHAGRAMVAFILATILWLPCPHLFFRKPLSDFYQGKGISRKAKQLAARHLQLWTDPVLRRAELKKMRTSNAEWDFMGRSFLIWSLANMVLRDPPLKSPYLPVIDQNSRALPQRSPATAQDLEVRFSAN